MIDQLTKWLFATPEQREGMHMFLEDDETEDINKRFSTDYGDHIDREVNIMNSNK